jgi:hypothetical protein
MKKIVLFGILLLVTCFGGQAFAYSTPPSWIPMEMLDITYSNGRLAVTPTSGPALLAPNTLANGNPSYTGTASFDPAKPWNVLNSALFSRRFGWNDPNQGTALPDIYTQIRAVYPTGNIWIQVTSKSPALRSYQAVGQYGVNADDSQNVDPAVNGYAPIFGTSGSSTRWKWDGMMDHNANAVALSDITTSNQLFSATYRIYIGDAAGNDLAPAAATTTTWQWQGPATVPIVVNSAVPALGPWGVLAVVGALGVFLQRRQKALVR